jgi:hypothetical protein
MSEALGYEWSRKRSLQASGLRLDGFKFGLVHPHYQYLAPLVNAAAPPSSTQMNMLDLNKLNGDLRSTIIHIETREMMFISLSLS